MFAYHIRMAWLSIRQAPVLSALIVLAIALGIGLSMTTITLQVLMSGDPIPAKSDQLYAVRIDNYGNEVFLESRPDEPPWWLAYQDANNLLSSPVPQYQTATYKVSLVVNPEREEITPFYLTARVATNDFFPMFEVPFVYGTSWGREADVNQQDVVIITKSMNDRLFSGNNSVGERLRLSGPFGDRYFSVVGVIDDWDPTPKFYDAANGSFELGEDLFVPFSLASKMELPRASTANCWKREVANSYMDWIRGECVWVQYWVQLENDEQRGAYQSWLDAYVLEQQKLGRLTRPLNNRLDNVMAWLTDVHQVVPEDVGVLVALALLFLLVCLFNAVGLLLSRFMKKAPLIGVRRALGASKKDIFYAQLVEVGLIGFVGGLVGLLFSMVGLMLIRSTVQTLAIENVTYLNFQLVVMALGLSVAAAIMAGLYPAWRACAISPSIYLKTQ